MDAIDAKYPKGTGSIFFSIIMLIAGLQAMCAFSLDVGAAQPLVTVTLDETTIDATVDEESSEMVESTGSVTADSVGPGSSVQSIRVELEIDFGGWAATITPSSMVFPPEGGTENFTWSGVVPAATGSGSYKVTISGRATAVPGTVSYRIPESGALVNVNGEDPVEPEDDGVQVTDDGGDKLQVRIEDDTVAWLDMRNNGIGRPENDVYATDLGSGNIRHLVNDTNERYGLEIDEGRGVYIRWVDEMENVSMIDLRHGGETDIHLDLEPSPTMDINHYSPVLLGDRLAYCAVANNDVSDLTNPDADAYVYDLETGENTIYSGTTVMEQKHEFDIRIQDAEILFMTETQDSGAESLTLVDIGSGSEATFDLPSPEINGPIDWDGEYAVFTESRDGSQVVWYLHVETRQFTVIDEGGYMTQPRIDQGRIVFIGDMVTGFQVFMYDIDTRSAAQVSHSNDMATSVDISGDTIVCISNRGEGDNIYSYDVSEIASNKPPVINTITASPEVIQPSSVSTIVVDAEDPDGDYLTFEYTATGGTIDGNGSVASWEAPDEEGNFTITVTASDGQAMSKPATVDVTVSEDAPEEHPPVIDSVIAHPTEVEAEGEVEVTVTAHDDDDDDIQFMYTADGGEFDSDGELTDEATDTWKAPVEEGTYTLTVMAYDGMYYSEGRDVEILVTEDPAPPPGPGDNHPPVIEDVDVDPAMVEAGGKVKIKVTASDPDGDDLSYFYAAEGGEIDENDEKATWTAPDEEGTYTITVTVQDPSGTTDSEKVKITVFLDNAPPGVVAVTATPNEAAADGETTVDIKAQVADVNGLTDIAGVTIDLSALDGDKEQEMKDDGRRGDAEAGDGIFTYRFVIDSDVTPGRYNLTVTVTDLAGGEDTDRVSLKVVAGPEDDDTPESRSSVPGFGAGLGLVALAAAAAVTVTVAGRRKR